MNNPDHISESLETIFWAKILKFFGAPGWKKFGSGINIPDPKHWLKIQCKYNMSDLIHVPIKIRTKSFVALGIQNLP
jgi:hypothetical protein